MPKRKISSTNLDIITLNAFDIAFNKIKDGKGNEYAFPTGAEKGGDSTWISYADHILWLLRENMKDINGKIHS